LSIQIPRLDLEHFRHVSPTPQRTQFKYPSRIKESEEENLLQKMHTGKSISQIDRKVISHLNLVLPSLSLSYTIIE
jgi:hypothetical protein